MRRTRKHNRYFKRNHTRSGGNNNNNNNKKPTPKPTIEHPNNLPNGTPPRKRETDALLNFLKPESSRRPDIYRSYFRVQEGFKGGGVAPSRPLMQSYPPLPESPTPRPPVFVNNESLIPVKKGSNEYQKRADRLINQIRAARYQTLKNRILGKPKQTPQLNSHGYPKSFFTVNNRGFRPTK